MTKPILLNIFFILLFSMITYGISCSDTDGGINRLVGGRVTWDIYEIYYYDDCCTISPDYDLNEYYCSGGAAYSTVDDCASVYGEGSACYGSSCGDCPDGLCPVKARCIIGCTDLDDLNYLLKSNVSYNSNYYWDSCQDKTRLNEYNCSGSPQPTPQIKQINCSTQFGGWWWNCSNGACKEGDVCSDTDYGKDYFNKGIVKEANDTYTDYCLYPYINESNDLSEFFCNSTTGLMDVVLKDCSTYGEGWSCFNGVCNIQSCLDVDGENFFSEGYVMYGAGNNTETYTDYCDETEPNLLYEFICADDSKLDAVVKYCADYGENYKCEFGRCAETSAPSEDCPYPILFCDKFNYMSDISINGWRVYNQANKLKQLAPQNNILQFGNDFEYTAISYSLNPFNLQFFKNGYWYYIMETPYSPVMTVQFDVSIPNISFLYQEEYENESMEVDENNYINFPCLSLKSMTVNNNYLYWFLLCGNISDSGEHKGTLLYVNSSLLYYPSFSYAFGIDALPLDEKFNFKITWYFKNRDIYDEFDSNIPFDFYKIWINDNPLYVTYYSMEGNTTSDIILYQIDDNSGKEKDSLKKVILEKLYTFRGFIDNFYIITGDDIYYDTTMDYFGNVSMEFYEVGNISEKPAAKPKDFAEEVNKIWSTFGLRSAASKTLFGLLLLCIIGIGLVAVFISTNNPVNFPSVAFILIIFMVLFVYLKLLPLWIPIILGIIAVGIIVWLVKTHFTSGG